MSLQFWLWFLTLIGAGIFFLAGDTWSRQRKSRQEVQALDTLGSELEATRAHMLEQEQHKRVLHGHELQLGAELARVRSEADELNACLGTLRTQTTSLKQETERARRDRDQLSGQLQALNAEHAQIVASLAPPAAASDPAAPDATVGSPESRLRQELSLARDFLQSRTSQLEQLREENARLRSVDAELERAKRELADLAEQTRLLRAEAYAAKRVPSKPPERARTVSTRGDALQSIVDNETEHGHAKSAVIADELGLVVAASGLVQEYGDALAALGAYLADVGSKTRDVLPLHEVRQVVVRDDHHMTLTVRPLATEDSALALVTLAVETGAGLQPEDTLQLR